MARHRAPRRQWFRKQHPVAVAEPQPATQPFAEADLSVRPTVEDDDYADDGCEDGCEDCAMDAELDEFFEPPQTAPVARVVDLAERRPRQTTGAEIVMMSRAATDAAVQAVYPDGSIEQVPCELRVVATLPAIRDGMILNVTGGGRSAAIAVTHSP